MPETRTFSCGYDLDADGRRGRPLRRNLIDLRYGNLITIRDKGTWIETDPENDGIATVTVTAEPLTLEVIANDPDINEL